MVVVREKGRGEEKSKSMAWLRRHEIEVGASHTETNLGCAVYPCLERERRRYGVEYSGA
jgi:hypothetical protein